MHGCFANQFVWQHALCFRAELDLAETSIRFSEWALYQNLP